MSKPISRRQLIRAGEQILIECPGRGTSRYEIEAPNICYGWDYAIEVMQDANLPPLPSEDIAVICDNSPLNLRRAAHLHARYLQRQLGLDFQQYEADHPSGLVFLWSVNEGLDRVAIGAVHFVHCTPSGRTPFWRLNWAWFHPYMRRQGRLKAIWPYFCSRFGRFHVEPPVSPEMEKFLLSMGCSDWISIPDDGQASGDWSVCGYQSLSDIRPKNYQLENYYPNISTDEDENYQDTGEFYDFLINQIGREDGIGDIAKVAFIDKYWPTKGGLLSAWQHLVRTGFFLDGLNSLRDAWDEYHGYSESHIDIDTHRRIASRLFRVEALLRETIRDLRFVTGTSASTLWHMIRRSEEVRDNLREMLLGNDREIYITNNDN